MESSGKPSQVPSPYPTQDGPGEDLTDGTSELPGNRQLLLPSEPCASAFGFEAELAGARDKPLMGHAHRVGRIPRGHMHYVGRRERTDAGQDPHHDTLAAPLVSLEVDRLSVGHPFDVGLEVLDVGPDFGGRRGYVDTGLDVSHVDNLPSLSMVGQSFRQKPTGMFKHLLHAPVWVFRSRLGFLFGNRFVMLEHVGRRTGQTRYTPLEVVERNADAFTICSGTGPDADWYRNIRTKPAVALWVGSKRHAVEQRLLTSSEAATAFARYEAAHPKAAERLMELMGASHDGTHEGRRRMVESIPMVELRIKR